MVKTAEYFSQITDQKNGFKFAKPVRPDEKAMSCVIPILQREQKQRSYITLPETIALKIKDSGKIDQLIVRNDGQETVFLRTGTLVKGGTQERAISRSHIVFAGEERMVECRCIHQSKGIRVGTEVKYGGITPLDLDRSLYSSGYVAQDQYRFWTTTSAYSSRTRSLRGMTGTQGPSGTTGVRASSSLSHPGTPPIILGAPAGAGRMSISNFNASLGSDDLVQEHAEFLRTDAFTAVLSKLKLLEDQAGLAILDEQGVSTVELFDVHISWKALHEDAVKRAGTNLVRDDSNDLFEFKEDRAVKILCSVLSEDFKENVIYKHAADGSPSVKIIGLTGKKHIGELVELDGRVIHMLLNRAA